MYTIQYSQTASWLVAILATVNLPGLMARCSSGRGPQGVETWKIRPESFHHDAVLVVSSDCLGFWKTRCFLQFGNRNLFVCPSVHLCEGCTESSPFCSTLNTITSQVWTCVKDVPKAVHSVATLNTSYITGLDMSMKYVPKAVHSVALWTRVASQVWTCVKYVPKAVHSVALWTRVTSQVWTCVNYVPKYQFEQERHHMLRNSPWRSTYVQLNQADEHKKARNTKN